MGRGVGGGQETAVSVGEGGVSRGGQGYRRRGQGQDYDAYRKI
jgi:hypothetical protein